MKDFMTCAQLIKCPVCGARFYPQKEKVVHDGYRTELNRTYYDAMDCPVCHCQIILGTCLKGDAVDG